MKQLIILLVLAGITYSCTNETDRILPTEIQAATLASDLQLDSNNSKWRADEATTATVESLQQLMVAFGALNSNFTSVEACQELGWTMEGALNSLFRQCTMTGPAHDELHKFLVPILKDIKILKGDNLEAAVTAQMRIDERLSVYQAFFE